MAIKFIIQAGRERLESNGGLVLGGKILAGLDLDRRVNGIIIDGALEPKITNADVLRSYCGLLIMGRTNYEDIELFRHDGYFRRALGIKRVPSSGTLRQRLDGAEGRFDEILKEANGGLLNAAALTPVKTERGEYLPVDVDVSPFDNSKSQKEGTGRTYKGTDGYAPNFAYVGAEGYMLNCELRPGTQHCQKGTPEFLRETFELLGKVKTEYPVLLRMDSGNDAAANVRQCRAEGRAYIIKRNLRKESLDDWLGMAKIYGVATHPRPGKTVYIGACYRFMKDGAGNFEPWRIVFEVTVRTITAKGEQLLIPEIEADTYWTGLEEYPGTVIELYHGHGTSEQFHSELKSDMDVERLPSGKFKTNATILQTAMMAFNTLRRIGQEILALVKETSAAVKEQRWRLRTVLQTIMYLACKYVERSHRHFLRFGQNCQWLGMIRILYARL
jgi:hypothetical protein